MSVARAAATEVVRIAKEQNCNLILGDYREASLRLSTMEIYKLPDMISEIAAAAGLDANRFKRAAIIANDFSDFSFFETVTVNALQKVKLFRAVDEAREWLSRK